MAQFRKVAAKPEIPPGAAKSVSVDGKTVALFNAGGAMYAMDDACLHRGGPLSEGCLEGLTVTCPWHAWKFDVKTGACSLNPAMKLRTYEVRVEGDDVLIGL